MAKAHEPWSDEMISAYLDDEVSSTERELIERALQQDARCRELYEQLRACAKPCRRCRLSEWTRGFLPGYWSALANFSRPTLDLTWEASSSRSGPRGCRRHAVFVEVSCGRHWPSPLPCCSWSGNLRQGETRLNWPRRPGRPRRRRAKRTKCLRSPGIQLGMLGPSRRR